MPSEFIQRQKNDFFRDLTSLGSLWFYLLIALAFLIQKDYRMLKQLTAGFILMYIIVILIRSFYFKNRPKRYSHHNFIEKIDASSFPSLHGSRISFLCITLAEYFSNNLLSILLVILTALVAHSRLYLKKHDKSDVLTGILLGIAVYFVMNRVF